MKNKTDKPNAQLVPNDNPNYLGFFEKHADVIASLIIIVTMLMGMFLFNMRVDEGGDDSTYITRAIDLFYNGTYPTYQGPLYPIFLAMFVGLFGANLLCLKFTSLALILVSQFLFYRMLKGHVNIRLILGVMGLMSINSWFLFFGSMTYSEALFMVVEYAFLALLLRFENKDDNGKATRGILGSLSPAALAVVAFLIRTVGLGFSIVGVAYLCIRKKYAKALMFLGSVIVLSLVWTGIRTVVWGDIKSDNKQLESLMQVHPYDESQGLETISGYAGRLVDNSNLYLSKHMMRMLGFRKAQDRGTNPLVTIILYSLFFFGAYKAWKKNRCLLLLAITSFVMLGLTFVVLQSLWDQARLIIPYFAIFLMIVLYGIFCLLKIVAGKKAHLVFMLVVILSGLMTFAQSVEKMDFHVLRENFSGDILYGYTPDWYNYLSICKEVYSQLPEGSYVACRKPNMARIYSGGHKFYGIYNFNTEDADELVDDLRNHKVTHVILASLRRDPLVPNGQVINTIHRYMNFINQKYPKTFIPYGMCGDENSEPAYLFAVDYDYVDAMRQGMVDNNGGDANE